MSPLATLASTLAQASDNVNGSSGAGLFAGVGLIFLLLALVASVFWIWMLIDCLTSNLPSTEKLVWALVIFFFHLLGAIVYFFVARGNRSAVRT